jgi:hypothetical protein
MAGTSVASVRVMLLLAQGGFWCVFGLIAMVAGATVA